MSNDSWITVTSGATGTGNGSVTFTVAANSVASPRTGTLTVAGQTFTVTEDAAACSYSIMPTSQNVVAAGGSGSTTVTAGAGCAWTAVANDSWITVTSGASGTGGGSVNFSVDPNAGAARTGTLTIAGETFTVNQDGI